MITIWAVKEDGNKKVWLHVYNEYEATDLCEFNNWRWKDEDGEWELMFKRRMVG